MWEVMTNTVLRVLAIIPAERRARTEAHENMRIAVMDAFHETLAYYETRFDRHDNIRKSELHIAQLWTKASILVESFDVILAERLGKKSQFWRDEATWSDEEVESAGIGLDRVRLEAMILQKYCQELQVGFRQTPWGNMRI